MPITLETWQLNMLQPAQYPNDARQDAVKPGVSLTVVKGQALAIKTADSLAYPLATAASDGTQNAIGFSMYDFKTDSNGKVYFADSTTASWRNSAWDTAPYWKTGIFDPTDLTTNASGNAVAEVDTFTPTSPTTNDVYTMYLPNGDTVSATVGGTQTATATVTLLKAAWNANAYAAALATASGTATFILTSNNPGHALNVTSGVVGTGTNPKVVTTAASGGVTAEVDTYTPGGTITTGDVNKLTYTAPDGTVTTISFTTGGTTTATAVSAGLIAAWNANTTTAAVAVASGTTTVVLTGTVVGGSFTVASSVTGVGTLTRVATTAATGRSIADILPGIPGARILANGFWQI